MNIGKGDYIYEIYHIRTYQIPYSPKENIQHEVGIRYAQNFAIVLN